MKCIQLRIMEADKWYIGTKIRWYEVTVRFRNGKTSYYLETTDFMSYALDKFSPGRFTELICAQETDNRGKKLVDGECWWIENGELRMKKQLV